MTTAMTTDEIEETTAATTPRRSRRRSAPAGTAATTAGRGRRPRLSGDALVNSLAEMVDRLIKENRDLKRALARAEAQGGGGGLGQSVKTLSGLQRRLNRALAEAPAPRRRRTSTATTAAPRPRRKVTDPEVLERRRQALAKARAVRQAKREAGG
jgi:hypothetical protein